MSFDDVKIRTGVSWVANDLDERGETWLGLIATTNGKTKIEELNIKQGGGGNFFFSLFCCCCCFFLPRKVLVRAKSDKFDYFIWLKANLKQIGEFC